MKIEEMTMKANWLLGLTTLLGCLTAASLLLAQAPQAATIYLPEKENTRDTYFYKQVEIPQGKILRAWTATNVNHEFKLYINGKLASQSKYGRIPSAFRLAEEIDNIGPYLRPGTNTFAVYAHYWSKGSPGLRLESEVQIETAGGVTKLPIVTDNTWSASYEAPDNWNTASFKPQGWEHAKDQGYRGSRMWPRLTKEAEKILKPAAPMPFSDSVMAEFPALKDASDWKQDVFYRDRNAVIENLMKIFQTEFVANRYANLICSPNTHMGDSMSVNGYPVGNGIVFTIIGPYPFLNTTATLGPEYQYPVQWNPGTTFPGDAPQLYVDNALVGMRNQWLWNIRGTDVLVAAGQTNDGKTTFYAVTFAPPGLKSMMRMYIVANDSDQPLKNVEVRNNISRAKPEGKTLRETVTHSPIADAAGDKNTRTMISGVLEDQGVTATFNEQANTGTITIPFGDIQPKAHVKRLMYHVTFLETRNDEPVPSDSEQTLGKIRERNYGLLADTIKYWKGYNAVTTTLQAPGEWGVRTADFIDDVKMLVQTQQFARTGAVGPMWFFSDQWIRDACGPVKAFTRTGKFDSAVASINYHYLSSIACKKILNWLPMDVGIDKDLEPVEDWSKITMNYADRHANCEVPSWEIIKHYWYYRFSGDTKTIADHWGYIKRCYYGQFDNETDKIFRPDYKIPFHGDETYIYSGGEALWENRYDLQQNSYPGGNIFSADSSFELVAAGDALVEMGKAIGKNEDAAEIARINAEIRKKTDEYYWMPDIGSYAQGMSVLFDGQLNRYPMGNIMANVIWAGYLDGKDPKAVSNTLRMMEFLMERSGVMNPILGYDVTVGMLQGQSLYSIAAINHPWAERAFYALLMIAGDTTEFSEWMAPGADYRTMYRANRVRPWEAGINLDAVLYYLSGYEPDAVNKTMSLTPRMPTGVYSPMKWDTMTLKNLPMGKGMFDLTVNDTGDERARTRTYTIVSRSPDNVTVDLNALIPFGTIKGVTVDGKSVKSATSEVFSQALARTPVTLAAGRTATVAVSYTPKRIEPVMVDFKDFTATRPKFDASDIVIFTSLHPRPNDPNYKLLRDELAKKYKVQPIDATLPTDPATFEAALLTKSGLNSKMLIIGERTMASWARKYSFWWDPKFDEVIGTFLKRGGIVVEANSGNSSSKWLEKTLAPSTFEVDYRRGGNVLAMDKPDEALDKNFYWLDEKAAEECGKWSAYWAGMYTMPYVGGDSVISDRALIWGTQEQPHGCMQYTMKTNAGKDHLIRIRTWPFPKKGFTLEVTEDNGKTWNKIDELWVPQPEDQSKNGWVDVYFTLPAKYVTGDTTTFRIGEPEGSSGGIGYDGYKSTGASRVWIRDNTTKPPSMADIKTSSSVAEMMGLPDSGIVSFSGGRIEFKGFVAPYRILGDSTKAALMYKPVEKGFYVKSELTSNFPVDRMVPFVDTLMDPSKRKELMSVGN